MRRFAAILVVIGISFSLILPAVLAADAQSNLAACCRRGGQHHCTQQESGSGPAWRADKCASFPGVKALPGQRAAAGLPAAAVIFASLASHPSVHAQTQALCRISHDRAGQKRGPPLFLL
jgi:hypothetical protein